MATKLFVGGLAWATTDQALLNAFTQYGEIVEAKVITDRETGRSRGFGFVTFADKDVAATAVAEMDGADLDGRAIRVNEAHDRGYRSGAGAGAGGGERRSSGGGSRSDRW